MIHLNHGDCLEVMKTYPDGFVDMVFADLPYGVTQNKWDSVIPFEPLWAQLLRVAKKNAAFVFTATQPFATSLIMSNRKMFRYDLIWWKGQSTGFFNAKIAPLRCHETMLIFYKGKPIFNPQMWDSGRKPNSRGSNYVDSGSSNYGNFSHKQVRDETTRYPLSIVQIKNRDSIKVHPTQKPIALLEWLVKTYTNEGDLVLDPTMGSGTTGVACVNTGRSYVGIEKEREYYAVACERIGFNEGVEHV